MADFSGLDPWLFRSPVFGSGIRRLDGEAVGAVTIAVRSWHDLARLQKSIARLLTAYQEDLLSLDELRHRMPELRRREYPTRAALQSIAEQTTDRAAYLRLAETLTAFLARLRSSAETLDIIERQRVVRLLVKEILVSDDRIVIRLPC